MSTKTLAMGILLFFVLVGLVSSAGPNADRYIETITGREGRRYCIFDDMTWNYALYDDVGEELCVPYPVSPVAIIRIRECEHRIVIDRRPAPP